VSFRASILIAKVANNTKEKIENAFKIKEHAVCWHLLLWWASLIQLSPEP
jgi:hypothetical protein